MSVIYNSSNVTYIPLNSQHMVRKVVAKEERVIKSRDLSRGGCRSDGREVALWYI